MCLSFLHCCSDRLAVGVGDNTIRLCNLSGPSTVIDSVLLWHGLRSKVTAVSSHPSASLRPERTFGSWHASCSESQTRLACNSSWHRTVLVCCRVAAELAPGEGRCSRLRDRRRARRGLRNAVTQVGFGIGHKYSVKKFVLSPVCVLNEYCHLCILFSGRQ